MYTLIIGWLFLLSLHKGWIRNHAHFCEGKILKCARGGHISGLYGHSFGFRCKFGENILILLSMRFFPQEIIPRTRGRTGGGDIERGKETKRYCYI